jgi:membrane-associated phospholipid phosphatase
VIRPGTSRAEDPDADATEARAASGRAAGWCNRDRVIGAAGVGVFVGGSVVFVATNGLFISTDTVLPWLICGLFALSLTDLPRLGPRLLIDWLPLGGILIFYDYSRGISQWLGIRVHASLQIHFDELLFGKPLLTVRLQRWLHQARRVRPWEYGMWGVYLTHFFAGLVIAAILWRFAYPRFREFRSQFVVLYGLGFVTYVVYPADPPWIVANRTHRLPPIHRVIFETWDRIGLRTADPLVETGKAAFNQVAALPSMHAATTLFICLFFWRGARTWVRVLLVAYVAAMAFTLVYSGEHYVFDVVLGWAYAVLVVWGAAVHRRKRTGREASPGYFLASISSIRYPSGSLTKQSREPPSRIE